MLKRLYHDIRGVAFIETAFVLTILMVLLMGIVELVGYIRVKERMHRVADEMAAILSTIDTWDPPVSVVPTLPAAQLIAAPYGVAISARYCRGEPEFRSEPFERRFAGLTQAYPEAGCNYSSAVAPVSFAGVACEDAHAAGGSNLLQTMPHNSFVIVRASCRYAPILVRGLPGVPKVVSSDATAHIRYSFRW